MSIDVITSESDFVSALLGASEHRRGLVRDGHFAQYDSDKLLNSRSSLAQLANALFWTSLTVEEGHSVRGSVCICSPEQAPHALAFERSEPLTLKSLIALFTASPDAPLAVHLEHNALKIWGILDSTPASTVSLRIGGTGTIIAISGSGAVALLHEGNAHVLTGADTTDLTRVLEKTLDPAISASNKRKIANSLTNAVVAMHGHHHGGAVVITPADGDDWRKSVDMRFTFSAASTSTLPVLLMAVERGKQANDESILDAHIARFHTILRNVGKLTAFDGAVVVRQDLTVLGFGAKLNCPPQDFTITRINAISRERRLERSISELGGTRHQSAARFVHHHHDCSVAISSQDGRLTVVTWVEKSNTVVAISGLEHFVWGES